MEEEFKGKENLRTFSLIDNDVLYIVLLETADIETLLVYRTLTCDRGMQVQEHQLIYKAKSSTFAVKKMFSECGSIPVIQKLVERARKSPTNQSFSKYERSKKEYVLTNLETGSKHRFDRVKDVAVFLGYKPTSFKVIYATQSKSTNKLYFKNKEGVRYFMTTDVAIRQKEVE